MRLFLIFILGTLLLSGCANNPEPSSTISAETRSAISPGESLYEASPMYPDSIRTAIEASPLLMTLETYNDSVLIHSVEPQFLSFRWLKKIANIALKDFVGFGCGFVLGATPTLNPIVGASVGLITGGTASAMAAKDEFSENISKRIPASMSMKFETFDKYTYLTIKDDAYSSKYDNEVARLGSLSLFNGLDSFFTYGITHNLVVEQFNTISDYTTLYDTHVSVFNDEDYDIVYGARIQDILHDDLNRISTNSLQWGYIFSDRLNGRTSISQAKAAQIIIKFQDLFEKSSTSFAALKTNTATYMKEVMNSSELSQMEKDEVMYLLPVLMCSYVYWMNTIPYTDM